MSAVRPMAICALMIASPAAAWMPNAAAADGLEGSLHVGHRHVPPVALPPGVARALTSAPAKVVYSKSASTLDSEPARALDSGPVRSEHESDAPSAGSAPAIRTSTGISDGGRRVGLAPRQRALSAGREFGDAPCVSAQRRAVPSPQIIPESEPAQTWLRARAALLYSGGEFDSFRHPRTPAAAVCHETVMRDPPLERRIEDRWFAMDKAKHLAVSFLWTLGTQYIAVNKGGLSEHRALPLSITSSAGIGVTKEYYDLRIGPTQYFSVKDLVADAVGILLGVGVILL